MTQSEKFCLKWNDFDQNVSSAFKLLREEKDFFDVSLVCEDSGQVEAHKVVLAACSPFFKEVLRRNPHQHPLIYLKGIKCSDLASILNFMYLGEANIAQEDLNKFLAVSEELQIKGLTQEEKSVPPSQPQSKYATGNSKAPLERKSQKHPETTLRKHVASDDDDIQEVVEVNDIKPEPREVMEVAQISEQREEVATYEGYDYDNYDGYQDQEGYQDDSIPADSQNNSDQYGMSLGPKDLLGQKTVTIGTEIFEKYSNAWRCGICKKMCSTKKSTMAHLIEAHQMSKNKVELISKQV